MTDLIKELKAGGKACHLMGLMSPGGVHSSQHHIVALAGILDKNGIRTEVHASWTAAIRRRLRPKVFWPILKMRSKR